jgi:hypothetical protein
LLATSSEPFVDFYNSKTVNTFSIQQIEDFLPELYFVNETKYFASKFGTDESKDVEFFFGLNWSENELFKNALDICFSVFGENNVPLVSLTCFNSDNSHLKLPALKNGLILLYLASYTYIYIYIYIIYLITFFTFRKLHSQLFPQVERRCLCLREIKNINNLWSS